MVEILQDYQHGDARQWGMCEPLSEVELVVKGTAEDAVVVFEKRDFAFTNQGDPTGGASILW